jgi:hypothetical protein
MHSYFVFKTLRNEGVIPGNLRFQISLPLVNSVVAALTFPEASDIARVRLGYEEALKSEVENIVHMIPHEDLAIQWDCSWEITDVYGAIPGLSADGAIERNIGQIQRLSRIVPDEVMLGFHFCFGTFGGWPRFAPDNLGAAVALANAAIANAVRKVDWIHIPALDTTDESFYAPLKDVRSQGARVYLGLVHNMKTFAERFRIAQRYLPDFGLGAYCGFGRMPATAMPAVLNDHLEAVRIASTVRRQ